MNYLNKIVFYEMKHSNLELKKKKKGNWRPQGILEGLDY